MNNKRHFREGGHVDYCTDRYNNLLSRWKKASEYLDNQDMPLADREKNLEPAQKILRELGELLNEIGTYTA